MDGVLRGLLSLVPSVLYSVSILVLMDGVLRVHVFPGPPPCL